MLAPPGFTCGLRTLAHASHICCEKLRGYLSRRETYSTDFYCSRHPVPGIGIKPVLRNQPRIFMEVGHPMRYQLTEKIWGEHSVSESPSATADREARNRPCSRHQPNNTSQKNAAVERKPPCDLSSGLIVASAELPGKGASQCGQGAVVGVAALSARLMARVFRTILVNATDMSDMPLIFT